ncbi:ABC transporter ATP-binding protein [Streptomyces sp. NPDC006624]|uniref:ABC transporter ATP-binding protein n=1 Tax=unclassified Streptomyces TaxID=2593676 RepID=UPI0033AB246C
MIYLVEPIGMLFQSLSSMEQGVGAYRRVTEVMKLPTERDTPPATAAPAPASRPAGDGGRPRAPALEFRDVWFGYDPGRPVLRGVTFEAPQHTQVALIGSSGVGKSTVFALIERFYDPDRGHILVDGRDVGGISRAEHRARVGLVEQHAVRGRPRTAHGRSAGRARVTRPGRARAQNPSRRSCLGSRCQSLATLTCRSR